MSVPAGLMQALQQGGGAPGPGGPSGPGAGGPPPGAPASIQLGGGGPGPDDSGKSDGDWEEDLRNALDALRALSADATDHVETNVIDKCIAALSGLTAQRQKGSESALGVTPAHKAMSRNGGY